MIGTSPCDVIGCIVFLHLPSVKEVRLTGTRSRALLAADPLLWTSIPLEACLAPSLLAFRRYVKTELFRRTFNVV